MEEYLAGHYDPDREYGPDLERVHLIPDLIGLTAGHRKIPVVVHPPALVIEILPPGDSLAKLNDKCREYLRFGVQSCRMIVPHEKPIFGVGMDAPVPSGPVMEFALRGARLFASISRRSRPAY